MRASRSYPRPAFTLMEIILVMVIFIIVASLSIPLIQTMLTDSRISASGDVVRGKMAEARARAMEEGRPWKFAFIANTGVYQLAPEDSKEWDSPSQEPDEQIDLIRDSLPKEIVFALSREEILNADQGGSPGSGWATAAIFVADGSAMEDTVIYFGKPGMVPMRAKLRALTGTATIETQIGGAP